MSKRPPKYTRCICPFCKETIYTARTELHITMREKDKDVILFNELRSLIIDAKVKNHFKHCIPYIASGKKPENGYELSLCNFVSYIPEYYQ